MSIKIGLLGAGTVGSEVARILVQEQNQLADRVGDQLQLSGVFVKDTSKERTFADGTVIDPAFFTSDVDQLIDSSDIVIELIGGMDPAKDLIMKALKKGKSVVTGNKAVMADSGAELFKLASDQGVQLSYEAAVAGAVPILRPIQDNLAGDNVERIMGIVNGTTNYILDTMTNEGLSFEQALKNAQDLGFAEADPTADVEGYDAASKAAILATLGFHTQVDIDKVYREGISQITADDVKSANNAGYVIKLLAICEKFSGENPSETSPGESSGPSSGVVARVHPTLLPQTHPLASVHGGYNAVFVEAENAEELMFYGPGAGGAPTASAVMGDVVTLGRRLMKGGKPFVQTADVIDPVLDMNHVQTRYKMTIQAKDQAGALEQIAAIFAKNKVSIETVVQEKTERGAQIALVTHRAQDTLLNKTVHAISNLAVIDDVSSVIRVE